MKQIFTVMFLVTALSVANAQTNVKTALESKSTADTGACRPHICMIDYNYHDDNSTNADMTAIQTSLPNILIDNTPGGYWHGGCLPSKYIPLDIQVFSYITSGYEGTEYGTSEDNLAANLARVVAIAGDGATGVFLDEVSSNPDSAGMAYIVAIDSACIANSIKLILNPGDYFFDTSLLSHCDYLMSDEHYSGERSLSAYEGVAPAKIIVVSQGLTSATDAAAITLGARNHGFSYSYACDMYTTLPSWLDDYISDITVPISTPSVTVYGSTLTSSAPYGNQWYEVGIGALAGDTLKNFTPTDTTASYYDIVTLSGCSSEPSNNASIPPLDVLQISSFSAIQVYPNPATGEVTISGAADANITIYNLLGQIVVNTVANSNREQISISSLANGIYMIQVNATNGVSEKVRFVKAGE